jgi:hypothetical protein
MVPFALVAALAALLPATIASGDDGAWDLAHPTAAMASTNVLGGAARGVVFDVTEDTPVSALGVDARFGADTTLTVEVRPVAGAVPGEVVASGSAAVPGGVLGFHDVPLTFTFLAGQRYDVRFQLPGGWGTSANTLRYQAWDNALLDPTKAFAAGPLQVLDGGGGFSTYAYSHTNLPHVHAVGAATDATAPLVDLTLAPGDAPADSGWFNAASSGADGVSVEVVVTDESPVARVQCRDDGRVVLDVAGLSVAAVVVGDGFHSLECNATDAHGNVGSTDSPLALRVDQAPPALAPRVDPNPVREGQEAVALPDATDPFGVRDAACDTVSTKVAGRHSVTCRAEDLAGNVASASVDYDVLFAFDGFFAPIRMDGTDRAKAGSAVPLKFSLDGFHGLDVLADGSPEVRVCDAGGAAAVADGRLSYDADTDRYSWVWKTDRSWAGTCREVTVRLDDGSAKSVRLTFT